jgi:integrase
VDYRDASGRRHRPTAPTREAAENILAEKIRDRQHSGLLSPDRDITFAEYKDRWLEAVASELRPRTLEGYKQQLRLHLIPAFGRLRVRELTRGTIKTLLTQKRAAGLSKNSVRIIRATLSVMLSDAADDGIILANPALNLGRRGRSRPDKLSASDRTRNIRPMSQTDLRAFLAAAQEHTPVYATLFLLLAHTGLRPGEAFALQWTDVDLANRRIRVERALALRQIEPTKTGTTRTVDVSEILAGALRRLQIARKREKLERGWEEMPALVFCTEAGTPLDERRVRKNFSLALEKARLSGFRLYDLRHTFASLLLALGAPITYVAAQLGHSKPTTTLQFYAHWIGSPHERFVNGLAGPRVKGAKSGKTRAEGDRRRTRSGATGHQLGTKSTSGASEDSEAPEKIGGPSGTRTPDPLIKSQLLYQLS